jgi:hypothetical protein
VRWAGQVWDLNPDRERAVMRLRHLLKGLSEGRTLAELRGEPFGAKEQPEPEAEGAVRSEPNGAQVGPSLAPGVPGGRAGAETRRPKPEATRARQLGLDLGDESDDGGDR